ncbi:MAG TPA: hypothetical protein VM451_05990 [Candidatus Limnocylindria bacterium]|nr:hypothetical protein [Candidatus Limnocylindria bacterium]
MHRPRALAFVLLAVVAACGPAPASPSPDPTSAGAGASDDPILAPTSEPAFGLTWGLVEDVERPEEAFSFPSNLPTAPTGPNTPGHPGNFPGQSILNDVAVGGDRLVAVGYTAIHGEWTADSWISSDSRTWALHQIDAAPGSFAVSVVAAPGGGFVAVGRVGSAAAAWTSADGSTWERARVAGHTGAGGEAVAERMTVVIAGPDGFLAGGSAGPELLERHARFWSSSDGREWKAGPDDDAFAGAEIAAVLRSGSRSFLALGRLGDGQRGTGTVALRSNDGVTWRRINDEALGSGLAVAVVATEDGYLAVGSDLDEREAVVWASEDGVAWGRAPEETSRLHFNEKVRMTDVLVTPSGYVAIGNFVGVQYGTGTSWLSTTGYSWVPGPLQAALGQAEPEAMVAWGDRLVAVGSRGAPDNYIPSAWISPNVP